MNGNVHPKLVVAEVAFYGTFVECIIVRSSNVSYVFYNNKNHAKSWGRSVNNVIQATTIAEGKKIKYNDHK
ncbi:MAG: hypothetical protein DLM72_17265 [Candidatus Nitrosopolaris wilkensis]|nr:MAG: hypothetical protein DLM72_17265 [Candidatus Nitrosopolaris wilkensis]